MVRGLNVNVRGPNIEALPCHKQAGARRPLLLTSYRPSVLDGFQRLLWKVCAEPLKLGCTVQFVRLGQSCLSMVSLPLSWLLLLGTKLPAVQSAKDEAAGDFHFIKFPKIAQDVDADSLCSHVKSTCCDFTKVIHNPARFSSFIFFL